MAAHARYSATLAAYTGLPSSSWKSAPPPQEEKSKMHQLYKQFGTYKLHTTGRSGWMEKSSEPQAHCTHTTRLS